MNSRAHQVAVFEVIKETVDAVTLVLDVPQAVREKFTYSPGQFLTLRIPSDQDCRDGSVARCYSLSSSPHTDDRPAVTVKRTAGGYASNWICDNVAVDTVLTVLEPSGSFVPRSLDADVLLCAAGSGITPVVSIAKSVLTAGSGDVALFYANRDRDSVIFAGVLGDLAARFPGRLTVAEWLEEEHGLPGSADIAALVRPFADRDAYICGPTGFTAAAHAALAQLDVPLSRIRNEEYRSLEISPFDGPEASVTPPGAGRSAAPGAHTATIEFEGETYDIDWPKNVPLLDVLLAKGLDVPYVCRESACGTCVCSVRSGRTRMLLNESLIDDELDRGLTLACQTVPETDGVHIAFDQD
ncbi:ferredoxin--NADP reductase [Antrihabitans sp. YC3-6]|uniref:Ferredoxin--NADP reductase n=1 Tax=Antrihabitans stalagmiti TaxID=2799499 RepID=A0A934NPL5_9NOCA|nr:ferredoxin--NADP reductase [Antrihabitans stalagmiti]MBJ8339084.1 ferredoxin--NADP reductase [Antrihabitans stalagmiti]